MGTDYKYLDLSERLETIIENLKQSSSVEENIESFVAFGSIFNEVVEQTKKNQNELIRFCAKNSKERLIFALAVVNLSNLSAKNINNFIDKDVMAKKILDGIKSFATNLNDYLATKDTEEQESGIGEYIKRYEKELAPHTMSVVLK